MNLRYILKEARYYRKITGISRPLKKFLLTQTKLSEFVNGPWYQKMYQKIINKKSKEFEPKLLQIENTNLCNARCIMCPHVSMKREKKVMGQKDFEKIFDNVLRSYKIERFTVNGFGEPLIDKGLFNKINYVNKKYPQIKIDIYTNASLLTPEKTEALLKSNIDRITFSVNGTRKNYSKVMGLDYDKTIQNIRYFLNKNLKKNKKVLTNISLMILDENKEEINKFMNFWNAYADSVRVYVPNDWAGGVENIIDISPFKINKRWPCFALWRNITVDVDGNFVMCCRDYESKVKFGNLLDEDIREIRESKKFKALLDNQLNFNFKTPVCSSCDNILESSLDWFC